MNQRIPVAALHLVLLLITFSTVVSDGQEANAVFAGVWSAAAESDQGTNESVWTFSRSGNKLAGAIASKEGDASKKLESVKIDGKRLSFQFRMNVEGTDVDIAIQMELVSNMKMEGTYTALDISGSELATGNISAEKQAKPLRGTWRAAAILPNGNEMESSLSLTGKSSELAGVITTQNGEYDVKKIAIKDGKVRLEFEFDEAAGNTMEIVVEAKQTSDDTLAGKWILIQDGNEVDSGAWRAARVVSKSDVTESSSQVLFDGSSLNNFRGYAEEKIGTGWKIVEGTLHLDGVKKSGDIVTKEQYANFVLEFEWKISAGGNSGVMYRVSLEEKKPWHTGAEYQLLDDAVHKDGKSNSTSSGAIYALYPPKNKVLRPVGQWNTTKIVLNGSNVEHWLNGVKVAQAEIGSTDWNEKVAASKFSKMKRFTKNPRGHICFQDHGDPVWFRNIKIQSLD